MRAFMKGSGTDMVTAQHPTSHANHAQIRLSWRERIVLCEALGGVEIEIAT